MEVGWASAAVLVLWPLCFDSEYVEGFCKVCVLYSDVGLELAIFESSSRASPYAPACANCHMSIIRNGHSAQLFVGRQQAVPRTGTQSSNTQLRSCTLRLTLT